MTSFPEKCGLAILNCALLAFLMVTSGCDKRATSTSNQPAGPNPLAYDFSPGRRLVYEISYSSDSQSDFGTIFDNEADPETGPQLITGFSQANTFHSSAQGQLVLTVIDYSRDRATVEFRFVDLKVKLVMDGKDRPNQSALIERGLSHSVFARLTSRGRVIALSIEYELDALAATFARALLADVQFVLPSGRGMTPATWTVKEEDPNGIFIARYERQEDVPSDSVIFRKAKARYLTNPQNELAHPLTMSKKVYPDGHLRCEFDIHKGHLRSIQGTQQQTIKISGRLIGQSRNTLKLALLRHDLISTDRRAGILLQLEERSNRTPEGTLSSDPFEIERIERGHRTRLDGATLDELFEQLDRLDNLQDLRAEAALFHKFKAIIFIHSKSSRQFSESAQRFSERLTVASLDSATMRILPAALAAIGRRRAQATLVRVFHARSNDPEVQLALVRTLGSISRPTIETEQVLKDVAAREEQATLSSAARLELGTMARHLTYSAPQRSSLIVDEIIRMLNASPTDEELRIALLALGNAGAVAALPAIQKFLAHGEPSLRAAAVFALRWIESRDADRLLVEVLKGDSSKLVRLQAARALGFRRPTRTAVREQMEAYRQEIDDHVRLTVLKALWHAREDFPDVREALEEAARSDPSEDLRTSVAGLLSQL